VVNEQELSSYQLDHENSIHEYQCTPAFRELIETENFVCVKGMFVINFPPYIERVPTGLEMTEHAKGNLDQCCLRFALQDADDGARKTKSRIDAAAVSATATSGHPSAFRPDEHNMKVFERSKELRRFYHDLVEQSKFSESTSLSFSQEAYAHVERLKMNKTVFCNKTLLSGKTYDRIKHNRLDDPSLETVMSVCIGLELGMSYGESLLAKGGYLLSTSPRKTAYKMLLYSYKGHSILECDELLEALNFPLLARRR
jgi:hypothetical protein